MQNQGTSALKPSGPTAEPAPPATPPRSETRARPAAGRRRWAWWIAGLILVGGVGLGSYAYLHGGITRARADAASHDAGPTRSVSGVSVDVAHPQPGGLQRTSVQAASVHAFEHASLYAKISGYLKVQNVDIGDRVKQGQVLAVIDDPEVDKAVEQNTASLQQTHARVEVAEAKVRAARADKEAAEALVRQAETDVAAKVSNHDLQEKQLARIRGLVERNAVESKLQDEQQDRLDVSTSDLGVARAAVLTAKAQSIAKAALIESAQADLDEARSNVAIAEANLARAKVFQDYTRIVSPYDGVVTLRSFHRGDFVRSATEGGNVPVLAVAVTDRMRVILPLPDVDVPFATQGDPATFEVAALPGQAFHGVISRFAYSEDPDSRTMRTEVDLPNTDGRLREGMYGRMTVILQEAAPNSVRVASSALQSQSGTGAGSVYVLRDGKAHKVDVQVGKDNGLECEVLSGLRPEDQVIVRYNGAITEGTPVSAGTEQVAQTGH